MPHQTKTTENRTLIYVVFGLLFLSGFTSLVYQVLWMRELGLLFGSSAYATAGTLAVFFGGLAIGGLIWSRRAPVSIKPLREYGILEIGIGVSGILYFGLLPLYASLYTPLYDLFGSTPTLLLISKLFLAVLVLLPPAILMGGNLPLVCQQFVTKDHKLGKMASLVYAANTLGAACGAFAAGFWLPIWLGFQGTYLLAILVSIGIGAIAWLISLRIPSRLELAHKNRHVSDKVEDDTNEIASISRSKLFAITFSSGALALGLEVLWTRMFQQVLQNSVYTFSIILVIFLAALAAGAFIVSKLVKLKFNPINVITALLLLSALATLVTPFLFYQVTDGMRYLGAGQAWSSYLISIFTAALIVLFVPGVVIGSLFPYLFRIAEKNGEPGHVVGQLSATNTTGAIVGSLVTGFVLLSLVGLWGSLLFVAALYLLLANWVSMSRWLTLLSAVITCIVLLFVNPISLPGVRLNTNTEELLGQWEGPDGHVAVIERQGSRRIKINNFYALGSSAAIEHEQNQTLIPLMPHPAPEQLFYLGMGTGITAGASLLLPSKKIRVAELVPEVITAAESFFSEESMDLFSNPRAEILARDGRNELLGSTQTYDAIIADLFVPWRAGVANVYSLEHFLVAKSRLRAEGVYIQWIPLYQMTEIEFWTLVRTFMEAFPQVQVWRGDFYTDQPILALVGSANSSPIKQQNIIRNGQYLSGNTGLNPVTFLAVNLPFYAGNLSESREIVPAGPIHTDNYPVIEYQAPISHRNARAGQTDWFTGLKLIEFFDQLQTATPPENDPYLSELDSRAQNFVSAGLNYNKAAVLKSLGRDVEAEQYLQEFINTIPVRIAFDTDSKDSIQVEEE